MAQEISPLELQKLMASETPHAVLDVRPGERFRAGQIFRSTTVPLDELRDRMPALVPVRSVITVLLHDDEESSKGSVAKAEAMGYSEIRWLEGGYAGWTAAGLPVQREEVLQPGREVQLVHGPLKGQTGVIIRRSGRYRLLVAVNFVGQGVSVEVGADAVERC